MRAHNFKLIINILCFMIIIMSSTAFATDYVLDTPGSTETNGSGTTYVVGDPTNKPYISSRLAVGDNLTLTGASGGGEGEYSIDGTYDICIMGASGQGNNIITLEEGSKIYGKHYSLFYAAGINVYGQTTDNSITGIVGNNPDNTVKVAGNIITTTGSAIDCINNNKILVSGDINSKNTGIHCKNNNFISVSGNIYSEDNSLCICGNNILDISGNISGNSGIVIDSSSNNNSNNTINISGNINSVNAAIDAYYSSGGNNVTISGDITSTGDNTSGLYSFRDSNINISGNVTALNGTAINSLKDNNNVILSGNLNARSGIFARSNNTIILTSTSTINYDNSFGIAVSGRTDGSFGNTLYLAGNITGSDTSQSALKSFNIAHIDLGKNIHWGGSNSFYLLNGASITGNASNEETYFNTTSYLINGYKTNNTTGKADRTAVDGNFNFTLNENITSTSTGLWDLFAAGGRTTLNGSTNQLSRLFIGADSFDGTTVTDGNDVAGNATTADLTSTAGATATLTVNNEISTLNAINGVTGSQITTPARVTVGSGSTYNLNGTHTHEFDNADSFNILGTMNLGTNGQIVDYQNNDAVVVTLGGVANNGAGATVGGTLNSSSTSQSLGIKVYNGSTSNVNVRVGNLTLTSVNNNGTLNSVVNNGATLSLRSNANLNTLDLAGTLQSSSTQNLALLRTAANTTGNVNINSGAFTLNGITNNGSVNFNVGKTATLVNNTGSTIDLSHNKGILTLDFGDDTDLTAYAKTTGAFMSDDTTGVNSIYAINGVAGTTYADVFDTKVLDENGNPYAAGVELNNTYDDFRKYILINNGFDILVENSNYMRRHVLALGGNDEEADAANNLVEHQKEFDSAGQEFTNKFTALSENNLLRGSRELIGKDATTETMQADLQSINAAAGAVRNQMTSFRMGSLSSGLASSFSTSGSTAATGDMADAEELEDAYISMDSRFTVDTTVYHKLTVWANAFGGFGEQGTISNTTGYDFWNAGTMVGLDYAFARELRIGGLFGYSHNKADLYNDRGNSTDNALRVGAYASYNWDNLFVDLSPTMGIHFIESERNLITNGLTAKSERTGVDFNINGTIGYTFTLPADIQFTPSYSLGYTLLHDPESTETGGGAGNLTYSSFNSNSLLQDIGIKIGKLFRVNNDLAFLPEVWGGWEVEYLNTGGNRDSTTSTSIGGNTYSTSMNGLEPHRGYWGGGLTALIKDNISVFGRYDHKIWHKGYNAGFSAGVKISF